jgi:hypothetical protein
MAVDHGRGTAALLAAGPHAVASHGTAAALWALIPSMPAFLDASAPTPSTSRDRSSASSWKLTAEGRTANRRAFEEDRARDAHLAAMGQAMLRFTWLQLTGKPMLVVARLAQAAAAHAASASNNSAFSLPVASATGS